MKILHTADIHLRGEKDERWEVLRKLIKLAGEEQVDIFAISGDLFDSGVDAGVLRPRIREMFSDISFEILLIPGNHDIHSYVSGFYFGGGIRILDDPETPAEFEDVRVWGMPFEEGLSSEDVMKKLSSLAPRLNPEGTDILLYHGELLDSFYSRKDFGDEGDRRYMPARLSFFRDINLDYVLAGHFHSRFAVWQIEGGGYFVYPGSPVSITRRETGRRSVNIFEVGEEPGKYPLDAPYFEEVQVKLDPLSGEDPENLVASCLSDLPPEAKILLTVSGYINSAEDGLSESDLEDIIRDIAGSNLADYTFLARDIGAILNDELFIQFVKKLEEKEYGTEEKERVREAALRAMMEAAE